MSLIVLVSLIALLGDLLFHALFLHNVFLHHHSMIFALVSRIIVTTMSMQLYA